MGEVTEAMLDAVQRYHRRFRRASPPRYVCGRCGDTWPCLSVSLAREVRRLRAKLEPHSDD